MSLIDTAVIGQASSIELAALGPRTVVCDYMSYSFMFLSIATSNMVATALARQDKNEVQHHISILLFVGLTCGCLMLLFTKFFGSWVLTGVNNMEDKKSGLNLIRSKPFLILLSACSGMGHLLLGYQTAAITGAIALIKDEFGLGDNDKLSDAIISSLLATAFIGAVVGGYVSDKYGRRSVLVVAAVFNVIGSIIMSAGSTPYDILAGRLIIGLGIGAGSVTSPLLIAESVPPEIRGAFICINDFQMNFGQFIGHVMNLLATTVMDTWRNVFWIGLIPAVIQLMMLFFLHESPTVNVKKKKFREAQVALEKTHDIASVEAKLKILRSIIDREEKVGFKVKRNALMVSILVAAFFQICPKIVGISFILAQAPAILQIGGVNSKSTKSLVSILISTLSLAGSVVNMVLVDKTSRKKLMIITLGVLFFGFTVLGFFFYNHQAASPTTFISTSCIKYSNCYKCLEQQCGYCSNPENKFKVGWCVGKLQSCSDEVGGVLFDAGCPNNKGVIAIGVLVMLTIFSFPAITSIPAIVNAEIHSVLYRGGGGGVVAAIGWGMNFLINLPLFSSIAKQPFGKVIIFGMLTASSVLVICLLKVPETSCKELEDVEVSPPNTSTK